MPETDLTAQAEQLLAELPQSCTPNRLPLDMDDIGLIYHLDKAGKTQTEIGLIIGCDHSSVSRVLKRFKPTIEPAKARAHNRALEVTEAAFDGLVIAARMGKPELACKVLTQLEVLPPEPSGSSGVQVNILSAGQLFGMPGSG